MDLEQLRAACEARVEALRLPHRFSTRDLRDAVAEQRGRPIILRPLGALDAPCGIRLETPDADLLFYEEATSPLHQNHILAHEISHIVCDHPGSLELDQDTLRAIAALLWPLSQLRRRRWERNSFTALEPLWREVTSAVPEVVLDPGSTDADTHDLDFHLHRRVIEINDGVLALRRYRQAAVRDAAAAEVARRGAADTPEGDAEVEAAVIAAAVAAKHAGTVPEGDEAPPATGTASRKGDLPAETAWLLLVANAYVPHRAPEHAGTAS
ncbi:MAB_1171c family putative transporter [Streptomyces sp. NPDC056400]|uniref:MAB_1171c family putative transporter n=1 Tax=Streptomyces sp. NPDC056400 TaxID=3345808 RepID=UPI0035D6BCBD